MTFSVSTADSLDNRLTSVANLKQELGMSTGDTSSDAYLGNLIKRASDAIENYTERTFQKLTVTETKQGQNNFFMLLSQRPVRTITSVKLDGDTLNSSTAYEIDDKRAGIVFNPTGWTDTLLTQHTIEPVHTGVGERIWEFVYTGGYTLPNSSLYTASTSKLPYDVEHACIQMAKSWYLDRKVNSNIKQEKIGDASITRFSGREAGSGLLPQNITDILDRYIDISPLP